MKNMNGVLQGGVGADERLDMTPILESFDTLIFNF